jgi:hypothetical protein
MVERCAKECNTAIQVPKRLWSDVEKKRSVKCEV